MRAFFLNAIAHAKTGEQKVRIMLAASKARCISDEDFGEICWSAA